MATLQEVHSAVQVLCSRQSERRTCINAVAEAMNETRDHIINRLEQLADLNFLYFSPCNGFVSLTESGVLTLPPVANTFLLRNPAAN